MIRTFGTAEAVPSRTGLLAALLRLRARQGREVDSAVVARRMAPRGTITTGEVEDVADANPTLVDNDGGSLTLTDAGFRAARSRATSRYALR